MFVVVAVHRLGMKIERDNMPSTVCDPKEAVNAFNKFTVTGDRVDAENFLQKYMALKNEVRAEKLELWRVAMLTIDEGKVGKDRQFGEPALALRKIERLLARNGAAPIVITMTKIDKEIVLSGMKRLFEAARKEARDSAPVVIVDAAEQEQRIVDNLSTKEE